MRCDSLGLGGFLPQIACTVQGGCVILQIFIRVSGLSVDCGVEGPMVASVYLKSCQGMHSSCSPLFFYNRRNVFVHYFWWGNSAKCS